MQDVFGRQITYVRVSVTDRCNLKCVYCIPKDMEWVERAEILSFEEIARLVGILARMGVRKVRLTGGEPTVRQDLPRLVGLIRGLPGIEEISLSTNALLLAPLAPALRRAGLDRVNVSLDSLDPERFRAITRGGEIGKVLEGIRAAEEEGLHPIKINVVAMRGLNDDEIETFALRTRERPWHVRFIEMMPLLGNQDEQPVRFLSTDEIRSRLEAIDALVPEAPPVGNGPATYFRYAGAPGSIGFITPLSHNFCDRCNRVRLTARGHLRLCLFGDDEIDLRTPMRDEGASDAAIEAIVRASMDVKPERHHLERGASASQLIALSQTGG
jgi:cyclic pyranopterin phosphate synthase